MQDERSIFPISIFRKKTGYIKVEVNLDGKFKRLFFPGTRPDNNAVKTCSLIRNGK